MPIDFSLLSSRKAQINGISSQIDKCTCGYKCRENALQSAPEQIPDMVARALANGIDASYVLMDSWFTLPPLVKAIVEQGLDVIGMVKETKQRNIVNGNLVSLKQRYRLAQPVQPKKGVLLWMERTTDFTGGSSFSLVRPSGCYNVAIRTSPTNTQSIIVNGLFECLDM